MVPALKEMKHGCFIESYRVVTDEAREGMSEKNTPEL